jgi:hypothetical protein
LAERLGSLVGHGVDVAADWSGSRWRVVRPGFTGLQAESARPEGW